jgi:CheY-like chemotaxis protein/two-component sensor histidine kinase
MEQAQKMEAIGNLAGGIAHDFNNLLSPIIGFSELMLTELEPGGLVYKRVQRINEAGNRAKDLVSQILSFSRLSDLEMMPVKFQKVLKEVLTFCRATIPKNIEIEEEVQQDCGAIWANVTQLHQIGMNLITNAYHAVQDKNGKITIALTEVLLGQNDVSALSMSPGKYALLSVSDNGSGMSEETKNKIFEPYFTTKEKGKGTGLGLAVVYGIVKELGGEATVDSQAGIGTTFDIYLPLMKESANVASEQSKINMQRGHEHILVVDDEPPIAELFQSALEGPGYTVTVRVSSLDALEAFRENPDMFDMVVSDMSMPHMTGDQLAHEIRRIRPKMPIVICTGFSERINKEKAEESGVNGFLLKPVVISEMADVIRKVFDEVGCYRTAGK